MSTAQWTVGTYLARRLHDVGIRHFFEVPGDFNLVLLDEFLKNPDLQMIGCCNELNAGYAADGYARATGGPAAAVVTFSVGGLSALNAIAGAYAEDLPVILISGGPNTNSAADYEYLHHTLGEVDYGYQREIYRRVTAHAVVLHHPELAADEIDRAIDIAMLRRKPVYVEVASNIANAPTSAPVARTFGRPESSDPASLAAAVKHASAFLNAAERPVLVAGGKVRAASAEPALRALTDACGYGLAAMANAKGYVSEQHANFMGIYWGPVSTPGCGEIVEAADAILFTGGVFNDYATVGHTLGFDPSKVVLVEPTSVRLGDAHYSNVQMVDLLEGLAKLVRPNGGALEALKRIRQAMPALPPGAPDTPLTVRQLFARVQALLDGDSTLLVEIGDSWFNGADVTLPDGARFEMQMQYGSIGWSVGATLGCALGKENGRLIACIGDGSFQIGAQELSTMIRYAVSPIIFLINNGGYTIEAEIHDGPYNTIKNWDYAQLVDVLNAGDGNGWGKRVATEGELDEAIAEARARESVCLIEVMIDRSDCNVNLLRWGNRVAHNNARPPRHR